MKIHIHDAHDRLKHFKRPQQADYISQGCADCIKNRPPEFANHPFYIFAHTRTDDDGVTKRLIWAPRLTKPKAQTNSMLFKSYPPTDRIKVIWMIPDRNMWNQYHKGNLTEHKIIIESIHYFEVNREKLEQKEEDDLDDSIIDEIYRQIAANAKYHKVMKELYSTPETSEPFQALP